MSEYIDGNVEAGRAAIKAGDRDGNAANGDVPTGYVDALTNIMHAAGADGIDFDAVLNSAAEHHTCEIADEAEGLHS
jgi:hypothetical protein